MNQRKRLIRFVAGFAAVLCLVVYLGAQALRTVKYTASPASEDDAAMTFRFEDSLAAPSRDFVYRSDSVASNGLDVGGERLSRSTTDEFLENHVAAEFDMEMAMEGESMEMDAEAWFAGKQPSIKRGSTVDPKSSLESIRSNFDTNLQTSRPYYLQDDVQYFDPSVPTNQPKSTTLLGDLSGSQVEKGFAEVGAGIGAAKANDFDSNGTEPGGPISGGMSADRPVWRTRITADQDLDQFRSDTARYVDDDRDGFGFGSYGAPAGANQQPGLPETREQFDRAFVENNSSGGMGGGAQTQPGNDHPFEGITTADAQPSDKESLWEDPSSFSDQPLALGVTPKIIVQEEEPLLAEDFGRPSSRLAKGLSQSGGDDSGLHQQPHWGTPAEGRSSIPAFVMPSASPEPAQQGQSPQRIAAQSGREFERLEQELAVEKRKSGVSPQRLLGRPKSSPTNQLGDREAVDSAGAVYSGVEKRGQTAAADGQIALNNNKRYFESFKSAEPRRLAESGKNTQKWIRALPQSRGKKLSQGVARQMEEKSASDEAYSTFSLHVSDVSFKLAHNALAQGTWPEAAKIRIEEFINAFDYGDPLPRQHEKVACRVEQAIHPFLQQRNLLRVSLRTAAAGRSSSTPLRLTLLVDSSGSMERIDRQETLRRAFSLLASQLTPIDRVTLISFARQPRLLADNVGADQAGQLVQLIQNLPSEGGTNIEAALRLAFEKAAEHKVENAQNRIVLFTDGAVNLGDANPENLSQMIAAMRGSGIAFDAAGISAEGLNDEVLEVLTRKGDGRYYMLDSSETADDGFVRQIAGALRPSAKNVKVQVEFNPNRVGRYKLLGFEKHRLKKEDFLDDQVDAAEMAAAEAGVALYHVEVKPSGEGDIGMLSVRFRDLSSGRMVMHRWPIPYEASPPRLEAASPSLRIASAAALLASKLAGKPLGSMVDLKTLSNLVSGLSDQQRSVARIVQLQEMITQARQLSGQ